MTVTPQSFAVVPPSDYLSGRATRYDGLISSANSFYDKEGVRQLAPTTWPRFDHNPATYAPLGWMNEAAATNLALRSSDPSNAAWTKTNMSGVAATTVMGPDGLYSPFVLAGSSSSSVAHSCEQTASVTASAPYVFAIDVKYKTANALQYVEIYVDDNAGNGAYMIVKLTDGSIAKAATAMGTGSAAAGGVTTLAAKGYYRIWVTATHGSTTGRFGIAFASSGSDGFKPSLVATASAQVIVSAMQFEAGSTPTSYIPTTSAAVLRGVEHYTYAGGYTSTSDALHSFCNLPMYRLNLLKYSEELNQSGTWTRTNIVNVDSNVDYSPLTYNSLVVDEVIPSTTLSADHSLSQAIVGPYNINGSAYNHVVYAKAHAYSGLVVEIDSGGTIGCRVHVDLLTGAFVTSTYGGTGTTFPVLSTAKVETITSPNGAAIFYRVTLVGWITGTTGHTVKYKVFQDYAGAQALTSYSGTGSAGIYLWGAQAYEALPVYSGYTKTDASGVVSAELGIAADSDPPKWVSGTTYGAGVQVSAQTDTAAQAFGVYQTNSGFTSSTSPELDTTNWTFVGPVNALRYMDEVNQTQTTAEGEIVIVFFSSGADAYIIDSLEADTVRLFVGDGSTYDQTITLTTTLGVNKTTAVFVNVPTAASAVQIVISRTVATDTVRVGTVLRGAAKVIGKVYGGVSTGIVDYSTNTTDVFGSRTIVRRAYSKRMRASVVVDAALVDSAQVLLANYRAEVVGYLAGTSYGCLAMVGFFKSFDVTIPYPTHSLCAVEVEGAT